MQQQITENAAGPNGADLRARNTFRHELYYSLMTAGIGLAIGAAATWAVREGLMPFAGFTTDLKTFAIEVVVYVVLFDFYFYGLHRALHIKWLYQNVHVVHHRSLPPTLLTALAFHPAESTAILAFIPITMCLIPIHLVSLVVVSLFLSGSILVAHCGYEVFPRWMAKVPLLNWYVTPRVHDEHHKRRDCNYSATLSIFDRTFRTFRNVD